MILRFWVKSPNLFVQVGAGVSDADKVSLSYPVHLASGTEIELATEENFDGLNGHIAILSDTERSEGQGDGIGTMSYYESINTEFDSCPASYIVEVRIPKPQFDELLATARARHPPLDVLIYVSGMDFGYAPDGSELKWDNKTSPKLRVDKISFTIPLFRPTTANDDASQPR